MFLVAAAPRALTPRGWSSLAVVTPESMTDEDLLELVAKDRDQAAFEVLYQRYSRPIYSLVLRILRLRDLAFSFPSTDAEAGLERWIAATARETPDLGWTRAELETHVRDEHSTFTWLLEPMLVQAGFEIVEAAYAPIGAYADYTCVTSSGSSAARSRRWSPLG